MRYRINGQVVLLRMPETGPGGPFAAYLGAFADSLSLQGYSAHHLRREVMLAALFSQWLRKSAVASCDLRPEHSPRFLRYRYRRRRANPHDTGALSLGRYPRSVLSCLSEPVHRTECGVSADNGFDVVPQ